MYKQAYLESFATLADAVEFEATVLSCGPEFLPACAKAVLAGLPASDAYWQFLSDQLDECRDEHAEF